MRRLALFAAVVAGALAVPATPASAHGGDAPDATAYRTTVTGVSPAERGLTVRAVEAGARLELRNDTGRTVEVLGYSGEPYLEVRPDGTYENANSPATYLNRTLTGTTPVPAGAVPTAAPFWRRVSSSTTVRWHDQRTHWLSAGLPPQAVTDPAHSHRLRSWAVPLREEVRTFEVRGTLDWVPPPTAWLWWVGAVLLAVAVTALGLRFGRPIGIVALVAGTTSFGYGVTRALDGTWSAQLTVLVVAALALVAGLLTLRRLAPFLLALGGLALAIFAGFADSGVFRAGVVGIAGPAWWARLAVLIAIGAGLGTAAVGLLRLRAAAPGVSSGGTAAGLSAGAGPATIVDA